MNRDLDAWIVKNIFGWTYFPVGKDYNGENDGEVLHDGPISKDFALPRLGKIHEGYFAPDYSDFMAALRLAQYVGLKLDINDLPPQTARNSGEILRDMAIKHWTENKDE